MADLAVTAALAVVADLAVTAALAVVADLAVGGPREFAIRLLSAEAVLVVVFAVASPGRRTG